MKRISIALFATVLLASCSQETSVVTNQKTLAEYLENPLFAEQYAEQLVDRMTMMEINEDPILENERIAKRAEQAKFKWLEIARKARKDQREGVYGGFAYVSEYVEGEVALINGKLYFAPTFNSDPGVDLHLYLTEIIDPRETDFPDDTSIDIGPLETPYGAQTYDLTMVETPLEPLRTLVLWDRELERLYGFVQLHR